MGKLNLEEVQKSCGYASDDPKSKDDWPEDDQHISI